MFPSSPRPQPFVQGGLVGQSRRWSHPQWSTPKVLGKCQCCARKYGLPQKTLIKTAGETHMRNSLNPSPSQLWETQVSWRLSWLPIVWREYTTIDVGMIYTKKIIYIYIYSQYSQYSQYCHHINEIFPLRIFDIPIMDHGIGSDSPRSWPYPSHSWCMDSCSPSPKNYIYIYIYIIQQQCQYSKLMATLFAPIWGVPQF